MTVNIVRNYLNEAAFEIESVDALINSRNIADLGEMYIQSYYGGWQATVDGPKGGHYVHTTGGTASAPTVGTPVAVGTIGTGVQAGYYWDLDGIEWTVTTGQPITPLLQGANGDGTDDTTAIANADVIATRLGQPLTFTAGYSFGVTGVFEASADIIGYGATLVQLGVEQIQNALGSIFYTDTANKSIKGITIDSAFTHTGIGLQRCDNFLIEDVVVNNAIHGGIMLYTCNDSTIQHCKVYDIRYNQDGSASADGIYLGGCHNIDVVDCYAYRPRRIGFVSEGEGVVKSDLVRFTRCVTEEAHNCDDSASEFNAAFWAENTNNVDWTEMTGINISSGVGQASGRVRGGVVSNVGNDTNGTINCVNCRMVENAVRIPIGYSIAGTGTFADVNFINNRVDFVTTGVAVNGGANIINIQNLTINDIVTGASNGGINISAPGNTINTLMIDNVVEQNATHNAEAGTINFFSVPTATDYVLKNCFNITHVMRGPVAKITVYSCNIASQPATYATFLTNDCLLKDSQFYDRNGLGTSFNFITSNRSAGAITTIAGCELSQINWTESVSDSKLYFNDSVFDECEIDINATVNFTKLDSVTSRNSGANGFIYSNFNVPTDQTLIVMNSHFETTDVTYTPLNRRNQNPTVTVLHNNTYNTTVLHDFTVTTSVVNNVMV